MDNRPPRSLRWLGALLVLYLGYPLAAFLVRVATGSNEGWNSPGLWSALRVSVEGATISVMIGMLTAVPLAYVLARRRGWLASTVGVVVQLPLAVPPLISGILLIYIVGPYTFLGQLSGQRLTQTMYGVIIAMSFTSAPFLFVVARSAFRGVDPSLDEVAATLGHGALARFLRVDVPAAADGLRAGIVLMWLRAFGEYGTVVILAYHPYSLPVYVDNLFSSAPLSQAEAPTLLAFGAAALAIGLGYLRIPNRVRHRQVPAPVAPGPRAPMAVGFEIDATIGSFHLRVSRPGGGHRLALVGPSGAGKSATLRALAGLLGPDAGIVTYDGIDVSRTAPDQRRVGYVPQGLALFPGRTVWQQLVFGVDADPARAAWWIHTLHLDGLVDRLPEQLSGGQRQRVGLARALSVDPRLVLLDEPFSSLDPPVRAELRRELRRLQRDVNLSTVIVTHDPDEAAMLADEIMVVSNGRMLQYGSCREVFQRPASVAIGRLLGIENLFEAVAGEAGVLLNDGNRAGRTPVGVLVDLPTGLATGTRLLWRVPPEALRLRPDSLPTPAGDGLIDIGRGPVTDVIDLGRAVEVVVELAPGIELRARGFEEPGLSVGVICRIATVAEAVSVWPVPLPGAPSLEPAPTAQKQLD